MARAHLRKSSMPGPNSKAERSKCTCRMCNEPYVIVIHIRYASQTRRSCTSDGSCVRYPRLTPSKYDLQTRTDQVNHKTKEKRKVWYTPLTCQIASCGRYFNLEVPELRPVTITIEDQNMIGTYNPPRALAVRQLLCISPLVQECVCCIELRGQSPF
jgi:hypothetical protein